MKDEHQKFNAQFVSLTWVRYKSANIHRKKVCLVNSAMAMHVIAFTYSLMDVDEIICILIFENEVERSVLQLWTPWQPRTCCCCWWSLYCQRATLGKHFLASSVSLWLCCIYLNLYIFQWVALSDNYFAFTFFPMAFSQTDECVPLHELSSGLLCMLWETSTYSIMI